MGVRGWGGQAGVGAWPLARRGSPPQLLPLLPQKSLRGHSEPKRHSPDTLHTCPSASTSSITAVQAAPGHRPEQRRPQGQGADQGHCRPGQGGGCKYQPTLNQTSQTRGEKAEALGINLMGPQRRGVDAGGGGRVRHWARPPGRQGKGAWGRAGGTCQSLAVSSRQADELARLRTGCITCMAVC